MKSSTAGFLNISFLIAMLLSLTSFGVGTSHWTQQSESDFKAGTFDNVVATNLSELKLSRSVKTFLSRDSRISAVYALAEAPDGTIYAGTGPQGVLLSFKDGVVKTVAMFGPEANIFSLMFDSKGRLLVGTGGAKGEIYRIEHPETVGAKPQAATSEATSEPTSLPVKDVIFSATDVQYVWAMTQASDGTIYAATGPNGQLFAIDPDGKSKVLFECEENNLLSLIGDGKDTLYVGTDPNGLVYRIDRHTGDAFVLYDAGESEVRSLVLDKQGNLFAATGDASEPNKVVAEVTDATERVGHPENPSAPANPLPSQPPPSPKPPELPTPAPGEPRPIPKSSARSVTTRPLSLVDDPADPAQPDEPQANPTLPAPPGAAPTQGAIPDVAPKSGNGNAVYRITTDGFVTDVFRQPVTIYSMLENNGTLVIGTGREGAVFQIDPAAEESFTIAKVDPKDVLCLLRARDGQIWMGLANSGEVAVLGAGFADKGTYTSAALDAKQVSHFGKINLRGSLPDGSTLTVATRSGNVEDPASKGWSKWTKDVPATEYIGVDASPARYLQYRLSFASADGKATPVVESVNTGYQMPNLAPVIKSIKVAPSGPGKQSAPAESDVSPAPTPTKTITWDAGDPNSDPLRFTLYFRTNRTGPWILLKDKLSEPTFDWNTRDVADGRYQIKVVASDAAANPIGQGKSASRVSEEILVNNAPPTISEIKATPARGESRLTAQVTDRWGTVAALAFSVDSASDWQAVLPVDTIADSPEESYDFIAGGLSGGPHQITLRATDSQGNQAFNTVTVTVEAGPSSK